MWSLTAALLMAAGCVAETPAPVAPPAPAQASLVAALDLSEPAGTPGRGSRAQAVFLKSMATQHPTLRLSIVDVSGVSGRERRNRAADWGLEAWPIRADPGFGPSPATTLLVGGEVRHQWTGFIDAATLDQAIEAALRDQ